MADSNIGKTDTAGAYSTADELASKGLGVTRQHAFKNGPQVPQKCVKLPPPQLPPPTGSALQPRHEHLQKEVVSCGVPRIVQLQFLREKSCLFLHDCSLSLSMPLQHLSFKDNCGGCFSGCFMVGIDLTRL